LKRLNGSHGTNYSHRAKKPARAVVRSPEDERSDGGGNLRADDRLGAASIAMGADPGEEV
jgi:hypothetical protein